MPNFVLKFVKFLTKFSNWQLKKIFNYCLFSTWHTCMSNEALLWNHNYIGVCQSFFFYYFVFFSNCNRIYILIFMYSNVHVFLCFLYWENHENLQKFPRNISKFPNLPKFYSRFASRKFPEGQVPTLIY